MAHPKPGLRNKYLIGYTDKAREYMRTRVENPELSPTQVADKVFDTKYPKEMGKQMEKKPHIKEGMAVMLARGGITDQALAYKYDQLLKAVDEHGNPQFEVWLKTLELIHKIRGDFIERKEIKTAHLNLTEEILKDLEDKDKK